MSTHKRKNYRKRRKRRRKKTRRKRGGKFLCGPDKDFVPAADFARLESIFDKLKEDTNGTALEDIVDKLPSISKNKGECHGCKELINELVLNTMPSFVGPKILPIEDDDILWLQQFTGVHKGRMCTIMGGRRKKKTRRKRGGNYINRVIHLDFNKNKMKKIIQGEYPDDIEIQLYYVYLEDDDFLYLQDYPDTEWKELVLPKKFINKIDDSENIIQIQIIPKKVVGGRRKKKTRRKRGKGKCASKPKYHDEEEIEKRIAENIKHMNIQSQKLEEIINASTCKDGTVNLEQMLENIKNHKGGRRKKTRIMKGGVSVGDIITAPGHDEKLKILSIRDALTAQGGQIFATVKILQDAEDEDDDEEEEIPSFEVSLTLLLLDGWTVTERAASTGSTGGGRKKTRKKRGGNECKDKSKEDCEKKPLSLICEWGKKIGKKQVGRFIIKNADYGPEHCYQVRDKKSWMTPALKARVPEYKKFEFIKGTTPYTKPSAFKKRHSEMSTSVQGMKVGPGAG
jgi:hypothetical protein